MSLEEREMSKTSLEGGEVAATSLEEEEVAATSLEGGGSCNIAGRWCAHLARIEEPHCDVAGVLPEHHLVLQYRRTGNSCMHRCLRVGKLLFFFAYTLLQVEPQPISL